MFDKSEILKKKEILDTLIENKGGIEESKIGFYACSCSGGCDGTCEQTCSGRCWGCGKS